MQDKEFFLRVLDAYKTHSPLAWRTYSMLQNELGLDAKSKTDHVAFRTFSDCDIIGGNVLDRWLIDHGYVQTGTYQFIDKKLRARSYSNHNLNIPRVFVSELILTEQTANVQRIIRQLLSTIDKEKVSDFPWCTVPWTKRVSSEEYQQLYDESGDYAAWVATNGLMPNHMTVNTGKKRIANVIALLEKENIVVSSAGGKVKGGETFLLEQGSTVADTMLYVCGDAKIVVAPTGYCEFAHRWIDPKSGVEFDGFIQSSADKIFESTDVRQ